MRERDITKEALSEEKWASLWASGEFSDGAFVIEGLELQKDRLSLFRGRHFPANLTFRHCTFRGDCDFSEAIFHGAVAFLSCEYSGHMDLSACEFHGPAHFKPLGPFDFGQSTFHDTVTLTDTVVRGAARFRECKFLGDVDASQTRFVGTADFRHAQFFCQINFSYSEFDRALHLDGARFRHGPPILLGTDNHGPVTLFNTRVALDRNFITDVKNKESGVSSVGDSVQRLRAWADSNNNHTLALECHGVWLRCKELDTPEIWATLPSRMYRMWSNYGQSLVRPSMVAIITALLLSLVYVWIAPAAASCNATWLNAAHYSGLQVIPLPGVSVSGFEQFLTSDLRVAEGSAIVRLIWSAVSFVQGVIGIISVFLIGLALRNRFRIG